MPISEESGSGCTASPQLPLDILSKLKNLLPGISSPF